MSPSSGRPAGSTLLEVFQALSAKQPAALALRWLDDSGNEVSTLSYGEVSVVAAAASPIARTSWCNCGRFGSGISSSPTAEIKPCRRCRPVLATVAAGVNMHHAWCTATPPKLPCTRTMRYQVASRPCLRLPEAPMNTPLLLPPPAACRRPLFEKPSFRVAHSNQTRSHTLPALPPSPPVLLPASLPLCPRACASACRPAFGFWLYRHNVLCTRPTLNQFWSRSMHYCPACLPALLPFCLPCLPALAPASPPPPSSPSPSPLSPAA